MDRRSNNLGRPGHSGRAGNRSGYKDNLIFIAILAEKLPKHQRDKARVVGLLLALLMRLALLASISWLATLTQPLFFAAGHPFSGRDLIMLVGGIFLLFKATMELNERLEGKDEEQHGSRKGAPLLAYWWRKLWCWMPSSRSTR